MQKQDREIIDELIKMVRWKEIQRPLIVYSLLVLIALPIEVVIVPYWIMKKINRISNKSFKKEEVVQTIALFFGAILFIKVFSYFRHRIGDRLQYKIYTDIKEQIMQDIMDYYKSSQKELPIGRLMAHMDNVPYVMEQIIYKSITFLLPEFVCVLAVMGFFFFVDPVLGCIGIVFLVTMMWVILKRVRGPRETAKTETAFRADHNQGTLNILDNMLYILIADSFDYEKKRFHAQNKKHLKHLNNFESANSSYHKTLNTTILFFFGVILLRLGQLIFKHKGTSGSGKNITKYVSVFVILLFLLDKIFDVKLMAAEVAILMNKSRVFLEEMEKWKKEEEAATRKERNTRSSTRSLSQVAPSQETQLREEILTEVSSVIAQPKIQLRHLSHKYPKTAQPVLTDINLDIPRNHITALKGPSGQGKTTLAKIILGLIPLQEGSITIDDHDVSRDRKARQDKIGFIPQHVKLFDGTLLDNIRYSCEEEKTLESIQDWIRTQGIEPILKRHKHDDNYLMRNVGIGGSELSGGQRQLVIILRSFLSNHCRAKPKDIFILDEPTSALDPHTKSQVMHLLRELSRTTTILIITHDPDVARQCDKVVHIYKKK